MLEFGPCPTWPKSRRDERSRGPRHEREPADLAERVFDRQLEGIGEALKQLAAVAQQFSEPQSTVELVQNAKGATRIAVKVYHREPEQAAATARRLYDELASRYAARFGSRPERGIIQRQVV